MGRDRWLVRALLLLLFVAILGTAFPAVAQPLGVVFLRPTDGATISDPSGVAVGVESFGGSDPDGNSIVERRFVFAVDGTTVADTTTSFPANHQESGFFWSLGGVTAGPHLLGVTVFDEAGSSATSAITVNVVKGTSQPVVWTSAVNMAVAGNTITKNGGCDGCGDAGAVSQQAIAPANGAVTFTVSPNAYLTVGPGVGSPGTGAGEIAFGLRFYPGNLVEVRESGVYKADWTYPAGATHGVAVDGGVVKYLLNGAVKYTSTVPPTFPLLVDTSVWTLGGSVHDATISTAGGTGTPPGSGPEPVVWTSPVNAAVSGGTVTKSGGCDGCFDAGAVSQQTIASDSGSVTFTTPSGAFLVAGLSNGNPGTSGTEIDFGLRFYPGTPGIVEVRESGVYKWDWLNVPGATHTIALEAGVVKYYQNGELKYTSAVAPSLPLLLDTALGSADSAVQNAVMTSQ
jgi:hypothetical protein